MNLPNKLTMLRIILIPAFLVVYLAGPFSQEITLPFSLGTSTINEWLALFIFVVAAITDWLDGYLARKMELISSFGKLMDPLADKMLVCAALVAFTATGEIGAWVAIVILCREFYISGFRQLALERNIVMAADLLGKIKTVLQIVLIIFVLVPFINIPVLTFALSILAVIFTIWSGIDYTWKNRQVLKGQKI